jgi:hypothetical protein
VHIIESIVLNRKRTASVLFSHKNANFILPSPLSSTAGAAYVDTLPVRVLEQDEDIVCTVCLDTLKVCVCVMCVRVSPSSYDDMNQELPCFMTPVTRSTVLPFTNSHNHNHRREPTRVCFRVVMSSTVHASTSGSRLPETAAPPTASSLHELVRYRLLPLPFFSIYCNGKQLEEEENTLTVGPGAPFSAFYALTTLLWHREPSHSTSLDVLQSRDMNTTSRLQFILP